MPVLRLLLPMGQWQLGSFKAPLKGVRGYRVSRPPFFSLQLILEVKIGVKAPHSHVKAREELSERSADWWGEFSKGSHDLLENSRTFWGAM